MPGVVPPVADERDALCSYLAEQRLVLRLTAYGLTDEQARSAPMHLTALTVLRPRETLRTRRAIMDRHVVAASE